ncbi:FAD-dependent monooxygenase [Spirilliplanes yamanashiensis]|uniref:FAD-binding domain-containing protein n=1 Tax=Spirilliplanes yamanashiensis TaxID=42233 RepID=A0A8J3Y9Y6_9ACTN|nr:FAD-dependent monooxygenase [Spirilliplanes yamanashiensis]MDP9815819.1 3-(3-hydroxy-phenyl)propionate hydroxylase [Spirilliplanes yamanashiensis]GIJ04074.1 hypothetical protein Sya03_34260 [Spirilliplanes yamanashiensis]
MTELDADVVVAGLGPVGGLLAGLLGAQGVRTVVVEPDGVPYPKPRAAVLDAEGLRALSLVPGMAPQASWATPVGRNGALGPDRRPLVLMRPTARAYGHPQVALIDQPQLEAGLRAALAAMPSVSAVTGAVRAVEQRADAVVVGLADGRALTARWLVGCDGVGSATRAAAGIAFEGSSFAQPWLVVDAATDRPGPGVTGAADGVPEVAFVLDPARPAVAMSRPGRWRWEWMLLPGDDPEAIVPALVAPWVEPSALTVRRSAVFTFHARLARPWRSGRVVLAGDAAHAMPPFAGAGLGMGLRDAVALAWRLAQGADLDGYERERRPDVARTTALALRVGRVVQTRRPAVSWAQRAVLRALGPVLGRVGGSRAVRVRLFPNPVVRVDGGALQRLDEVVGYRWAVIGHGCDPAPVAAGFPGAVRLAVGAAAPGCRTVVDDAGELRGRRGTVTVVRPDRVVHGRFSRTAGPASGGS